MAIAIVGTPRVGSQASGANVTLIFDVAPQENDLVLVCGGHGSDAVSIGPSTAGYTAIATHTASPKGGIWRKFMGSTPDTQVVCIGGGDAQDAVAYGSIVLRGVDLTTPLDVAHTVAGPSSVANPDPPSIEPVTNGVWIVAAYWEQGRDVSASSGPSGYSNFASIGQIDTNRFGVGLATKFLATAAPEDPGVFTLGTALTWYTVTLALRPFVGESHTRTIQRVITSTLEDA